MGSVRPPDPAEPVWSVGWDPSAAQKVAAGALKCGELRPASLPYRLPGPWWRMELGGGGGEDRARGPAGLALARWILGEDWM